VVALCTAALDDRISHTITVGSLASFVSDTPYENQRLGILPNGIIRDVGDVAHIAALIAPNKLTICGGVNGAGQQLNEESLRATFNPTRHVFELSENPGKFEVFPLLNDEDIVRKLN
jgi:hypothetical protein